MPPFQVGFRDSPSISAWIRDNERKEPVEHTEMLTSSTLGGDPVCPGSASPRRVREGPSGHPWRDGGPVLATPGKTRCPFVSPLPRAGPRYCDAGAVSATINAHSPQMGWQAEHLSRAALC